MQKKFTGELATPIKPRQLGLLMSEADIREHKAKWANEDHRKLLLLCHHYAIAEGPHMFYLLALSLAQDFVDGFKERKPRGRKLKWTDLNKSVLVVEIERIRSDHTGGRANDPRSVVWATKRLAKREPWKSFIEATGSGDSDPAEALRHAYYDFKDDKWVKITGDAYKMHKHEDTISEWESFVCRCCE